VGGVGVSGPYKKKKKTKKKTRDPCVLSPPEKIYRWAFPFFALYHQLLRNENLYPREETLRNVAVLPHSLFFEKFIETTRSPLFANPLILKVRATFLACSYLPALPPVFFF